MGRISLCSIREDRCRLNWNKVAVSWLRISISKWHLISNIAFLWRIIWASINRNLNYGKRILIINYRMTTSKLLNKCNIIQLGIEISHWIKYWAQKAVKYSKETETPYLFLTKISHKKRYFSNNIRWNIELRLK